MFPAESLTPEAAGFRKLKPQAISSSAGATLMTVRTQHIPDASRLLALPSPSFFMAKPDLQIFSPIPGDALAKMRPAWGTDHFEVRTIRFHMVQDVFIVAEGLIFDKDGNLFGETVTQHSGLEIEAAAEMVAAACTQTIHRRIDGGVCVLCIKRGAANYGHWLMEMLPKAFLAKREIPTPLRFIVPAATGQLADVIKRSTLLLGINQDDVIALTPDVVFCESLLVISYLTEHGTYMSPLVMDCMENLSKTIPAGPQGKIFVVRPLGLGRRFDNEDEFRTFLQCGGYQLVDTSQLTFEEQIATFKGAHRVVGAMGAAMTNIAFCRPGTQVTVFAPANMPDTFYWFLSGLRHLSYKEVRCAPTGPARGVSPWDTDLVLPRECLSSLLN